MKVQFKISENANPNYLCSICKVGEMLPIEGADKLAKTVINGYDIVIPKTMNEGDIVLYFPVESCICEKFLSANNLYEFSEATRNANFTDVDSIIKSAEASGDDLEIKHSMETAKSMCGFFNKHGRVRIIKLRGQYSQGFVCTVDAAIKYNSDLANVDWDSLVGTQFNYIGDEEFCWKYIPVIKVNEHHSNSHDRMWKKRTKKLKRFNRIREDQFAFHYDRICVA